MEDLVKQQARETAAGASIPHESAVLHVAGEATYVDDIPELAGTCYIALGLSQQAHANITSFDLDAVNAAPGVVTVITAEDIPGKNDCGPIIADDPILADGLVQYLGQPIFAVVATSQTAARKAATLAAIDYQPLPAILDVASGKKQESWVLPPMWGVSSTLSRSIKGDSKSCWFDLGSSGKTSIAAPNRNLADSRD